MPRLAYFGDLKLPSVLRGIVPEEPRGFTQVHVGVDRDTALHIPTSPNYSTRLLVTTHWDPETDYSKKGFRAKERSLRSALRARSEATHPVIWIDDSTYSTTISSFSGSVITTAANPHSFSVSDVVLVRRNGSGLYTVGAISAKTSNTITVAPSHAYQNGDTIHLVEAYWGGMIFDSMGSIPLGSGHDSYTEEATFVFVGSGTSTYSRTSVSLE